MSSKAEVIEKIKPTTTYIGSKVRSFVNEVSCEDEPTQPTVMKKGDVIRVRVQADGSSKPRPSVVIKVTKEYTISIPLTTTEDTNCLCKTEGSRFFKEGWFCNIYIVTPVEKAVFLGVYDNVKAVNNAIKELKIFINKNI